MQFVCGAPIICILQVIHNSFNTMPPKSTRVRKPANRKPTSLAIPSIPIPPIPPSSPNRLQIQIEGLKLHTELIANAFWVATLQEVVDIFLASP